MYMSHTSFQRDSHFSQSAAHHSCLSLSMIILFLIVTSTYEYSILNELLDVSLDSYSNLTLYIAIKKYISSYLLLREKRTYDNNI